ncbi:sensor histidine kinase [Endozoicomonas numazuensis]|uniref:sensor histidine kinase n=1 Tax=Endozoicomonas numazuensis TaxID=1137799 RepID=UPI000A3E4A87|nr:ATP-binding protein [Endozoicomonas numazuensis]
MSRLNLLGRIKASSLLRYTLLHTAIVLVLCGSALWLVKDFSLGFYEKRQDQFVQEQLNSLSSLAKSSTEQEFRLAVEQLAEDNRQVLVVLKSSDGYLGNLNYLPETVPLSPSMGSFWILGDSVLEDGRFQRVRGSRINSRWGALVLAYNSSDFNLFVSRFTLALYAAMVLVLLVGLITGFLFSRKVLARLNTINQVTAQVGDGELAARVPVTQQGDEFDELAGHINHMLDQIEASVEAIASVTSSIAHDLRTPLSRLSIKLDGYLRKGSADAEDILGAQAELATILHTFNAMLELTKLEYGQGDLEFVQCDLSKITSEVIELAEPLAEVREQTLSLKVEQALVVQGNHQLLFRILFNLVENAIKYSPEGSEVKVIIDQSSVSVIDQGKGIPEAEQDKVFQRLYRLDQSRTTPGHGLGMSLVKVVADLHGAGVSFVRNRQTFTVKLTFH